jgi:hypothetical protein
MNWKKLDERLETLPLDILFCAILVFWILSLWDSCRYKADVPARWTLEGLDDGKGIPYTETVIETESY